MIDEDKRTETDRKHEMCEYDREAHVKGTKKGVRRRAGLLAQEIYQIMQDIYSTDNYANIVDDNTYNFKDEWPEDY